MGGSDHVGQHHFVVGTQSMSQCGQILRHLQTFVPLDILNGQIGHQLSYVFHV
jgi:hypothetical protein